MLESQHPQSLWFTGVAAHQERTASSLPRAGGIVRATLPSFLRVLGSLTRCVARTRPRAQEGSHASPACCPAPSYC
jgi:hypothetical protein